MPKPQTVPYGAWKSPISSDLIVAETIRLAEPTIDGDDIYWTELRPSEGGRIVLVCQSGDGPPHDVTPPGFNVRTRVHEYGGGAYIVHRGTVWFSNFADQRLYRQEPGQAPQAITPIGDLRYADGRLHPDGKQLVCVREDHSGPSAEAANTLVAVESAAGGPGEIIADGCDFYSYPRFSPDGSKLAWVQWNHPNMPWDATELCVADWAAGRLSNVRRVAGGPDESVTQPNWSVDGTLHFISDRSGWWNLYSWHGDSTRALCPKDAEFADAQWFFGASSYGFNPSTSLLCVHNEDGHANLVRLDTNTLECAVIPTAFTSITGLQVLGETAVFVGGSPTAPDAVVQLDGDSGNTRVLRSAAAIDLDEAYLSIPQPVEFPTSGGLTAHAYYYPPRNIDFAAPEEERPPLLVRSHGGPTGATGTSFNLGIQYWTSRGYAFVDVNYGGSTGYGREYRNRLRGNWGVIDVDDCINAAKHLVTNGLADGRRAAIDGGSAGGYTTLCALTMRDFFAAGASHFGLSDLRVFVGDTHKFESRYLDSLIGAWPEEAEKYKERSPINYVDHLSCPVAFFQGDEDKIVPVNQAELMVEALRRKGLPVAYVLFQGEQHGFRKAENIKRALDGEFYFFARVFGFEPADEIEPLEIENL